MRLSIGIITGVLAACCQFGDTSASFQKGDHDTKSRILRGMNTILANRNLQLGSDNSCNMSVVGKNVGMLVAMTCNRETLILMYPDRTGNTFIANITDISVISSQLDTRTGVLNIIVK